MTPRALRAFLLALAATALPSLAFAQLPDRPVRIVVPFAPGGTSDIVARLMAQGAGPFLPAGAVVENKPGAAGNIGTAEVARSVPDGTTIVQCTIGTCGSGPSFFRNPGYDLAKDFAPVILTGAVRNVMVVRNSLPAKNLAEVLALAKAPQGLVYGSSGAGASNHLGPELLRTKLGLNWVHVPYRGSGPAITDLIGGRIDVFFDNLPSILPQIQAGAVRPIAAVSAERLPELPNVPTFAEAGVPGIVIDSWFGFLAPANTPPATIRALNAAFNKALQDPVIRSRFQEVSVIPLGGPPERMGEQVRSETARWGEVIRTNNLSAD
ncbi:tripartite tricarboxylate transporter substrate binding protein [Acetobacteraceae bacterium H6797]|nr:tripartite tricarboxylate transporter substrate binding protein [Acetobacteraceae bacterium H6797]